MATLNENLQRLSDARDDIANAIVAKGGTVSNLDGFEDFPADIGTIESNNNSVILSTTRCCTSNISKYKTIERNTKTWTGLTNFNGRNIWTDGESIYYSSSSTQYVLDKSTSTWNVKAWNGLTTFDGINVWTDGTNIYYSNSSNQYVLDVNTSTWSSKTWTGLTDFVGWYVWTDGTNIYYSSGGSSYQYVLDKATSTWTNKNWALSYNITGENVCTIKNAIYYQSNVTFGRYNKLTDTWITGQSSTYSGIYGKYVWTDGENIYCTDNSNSYIFINNTWNKLSSGLGIGGLYGDCIWTDGENIYYSSGTYQYVLDVSYTDTTYNSHTPTART